MKVVEMGERRVVRTASSPRALRPPIAVVAAFVEPQPGMVKIGQAAEEVGLSVQAIRMYEAEGLVISFKSKKGTRWYSKADRLWIARIHDLIQEGLNCAGIRRLLALLPCWDLRPCTEEDRRDCSAWKEARVPCWIAPEKLCTEQLKECYHCDAYRSARKMVDLKKHALITPLVNLE